MKEYFLIIILLVLAFGCENEPETPSNNAVITISGVPRTLEVSTEVTVTVEDMGKEVITQVFLDNVVINESKGKEFTFTIDPFDYKIGNKTMEVVSSNTDGGESSKTINFELKKLLISTIEPFGNTSYMAIHTLDGVLIDYKKIEGNEVEAFYAGDDFERQNFTITSYFLNNFDTTTYIQSYSDLEPGTIGLTREERLVEFNGDGSTDRNKQKILSISSEGNNLLYGTGGRIFFENGNTARFTFPDGDYLFRYSEDNLETDVYLFSTFLNQSTFENKYLKIEDFDKTTYTSTDFIPIQNYKEVSTSLAGSSSFTYTVEGYENIEDYRKNKLHKINFDFHSFQTDYKIRIPLIEDFEIFQVEFSTRIEDKKDVWIKARIDAEDVIIPDMNLTWDNVSFNFSGEHDYDYSYITYADNTENDLGDFSNFRWTFYQKFKEKINSSLLNFEHPDELLEAMNTNSLNVNDIKDNFAELSCSLVDYEDEIILENLIFSQGYFSNEKGNRFIFNFGNYLE